MQKLAKTYHRFSPKFWILVLSAFIDRLGGTIIFPFFSLYITSKFDVGMTEAGILLGSFSLFGFIGSIFGGSLADRFGRKGLVLFGLVFSALSSVAFGLINVFSMFFVLSIFVGFLSDIAGPAHQAMVADLLPPEQRTEGFAVMRISANMAWVLGPVIGGLLAGYSYLLLFILDAITSLIVAVIVLVAIPETKPETTDESESETMVKNLMGYFKVAKDGLFVAFLAAMVFSTFAYIQIYNALSVYLRDVHGLPERGYGLLMSANAFTVVLFQFWISARMKKHPPMLGLVLGVGFYLVGLMMYGIVSTYILFLVAMLLITIGEMIVLPIAQSLAAQFAPEDMRGRYMAFFGISWVLPSMVGPGIAGVIIDGPQPQLLWFVAAASCFISILGLLWLHRTAGEKFKEMEAAAA